MGHILLAGGGEFGGHMEAVDRHAIELAGGPAARVSIIPAAAAPDANHERAGLNGLGWFRRLGAINAAVQPLIDRPSAEDPAVAKALQTSNLIYLLGGFPQYLAETLSGTAGWFAMISAFRKGAVIGGSSAGAMVLCGQYYNPQTRITQPGLGLVPGICVLPHYNTFGRHWVSILTGMLPGSTLVGIDEETGIIVSDGLDHWQVFGRGAVHLHLGGRTHTFESGGCFELKTFKSC